MTKQVTIPAKKHIVLIAHDNKKDEMIQWCKTNKEVLSKHNLAGTGTTSKLIKKHLDLDVKSFESGPLGGDVQIGAAIVDGQIDLVIFFWDPLSAQPHDPDVRALLRVATLYDIPMANSLSTADFLISSEYFNKEYKKQNIGFISTYEKSRDLMVEEK